MSERHGGRCCSAVDEIWRVTMRNLWPPWHCSLFLRAARAKRPLFRLYGPEKPLFEKTWKLPDIEKVQ